METEFRIGVIANTHGVRGEVKVFPTTDDPARFKKLTECFVRTKQGDVTLKKKSCRFFKNMVILGFEGIDTLNDVEKYKGLDLFVTRDHAVPLKKGEYYIADLLGADVYDETDAHIGTLSDVIQTGANDVYDVLLDDGRKVLLPVIPDCILERNVEEKKIKVHIMKGLLDER